MERGEDEPLFDEIVINALVRMRPNDVPHSTVELNAMLASSTGSGMVVPIYSGNSLEDIARWLTEIESDELLRWSYTWYRTTQQARGDEAPHHTSASVSAITSMFCTPSNTPYLAIHYVGFLKQAGLRYRRGVYQYLSYIARSKCGKSLSEFYSVLEDSGIVDVLAYDSNYPFEKRKHALYVAAMSMCSSPHPQDSPFEDNVSNIIITCLAIVYAERNYSDTKKHVDRIIDTRFKYVTPEDIHEFAGLLVDQIVEQVYALEFKGELFDYYKDTIALALTILEKLYGVDVTALGGGRLFDELR